MTCMKLLASSIPGRESAKSVSNSLARPDIPANTMWETGEQWLETRHFKLTRILTKFIIRDFISIHHSWVYFLPNKTGQSWTWRPLSDISCCMLKNRRASTCCMHWVCALKRIAWGTRQGYTITSNYTFTLPTTNRFYHFQRAILTIWERFGYKATVLFSWKFSRLLSVSTK